MRLKFASSNICILLNHILLAFKYYVYRSREKHILNLFILTDNLTEIKKKQKKLALLATIKQKYTIKNVGALQITFYQWLNNIHHEKHTG